MESRYVRAGGIRFFTREWGSGEPVLMLHGFPQTGECWREVAEILAPSYRVIAPDLPGFGASDAPPAYDPRAVVRTITSYMDEIGAPNAVVVGHDWGGAFALQLALAHRPRVSRLVLVNSPFRRRPSMLRAAYVPALSIPLLPELAFRVAGDRIVALALRAGSARRHVFDHDRVSRYAGAFRDPSDVRATLGHYRSLVRRMVTQRVRAWVPGTSGRSRGGRVMVPTLIVWGTRDPVLPFSLMEGIERDIPDVRLVALEDCGHFVPDECPGELARAILDFLAP